MTRVFDVRESPTLDDDDFWRPIDSSDFPSNYGWHRVKDIARRLAVHEQPFVLSWCRTLGDKLNDLDPFVDHLLRDRRGMRTRLLDALGSVIDHGRIGHRQVTRDPGVWDLSWVVDSSWATLDVGSKALQEQTHQDVQIVTAWSARRAEIVKVRQNRDWIRLR